MRFLFFLLLLCVSTLSRADTFALELSESVEIPVKRFVADGEQLLLMLPSEHGFTDGHEQLARDLASRGVEVWQADLYAAYFLPVAASSLRDFSAKDIAALIEKAASDTGKYINLFSHDTGAAPLLKGVRQWQQDKVGATSLKAVMLVSPNLYEGTPAVGSEIAYIPIAQHTNFNLYIMQPQLSPKSWQIPSLVNKLQATGSDVFTQLLPGVRDRFFFRPDANAEENNQARQLADWLRNGLVLAQHFHRSRQHIQEAGQPGKSPQAGKSAAIKGFRPYQGSFKTIDFTLKDLSGETKRLQDYRGKVVLLNFWASWCPPCIHEMPSMQRLKDGFKGKPFEIVAVNMAEDPATIKDFLKQMQVEFEILLDRDGSVLQQWKVFAYPTSYVLGTDGQIRYAGFGAIDWAEPSVVEAIETLF